MAAEAAARAVVAVRAVAVRAVAVRAVAVRAVAVQVPGVKEPARWTRYLLRTTRRRVLPQTRRLRSRTDDEICALTFRLARLTSNIRAG
jgi:hypothetical protein